MTNAQDKLRDIFKSQFDKKQDNVIKFPAVLGNGNNVVSVPNKPNYVYYRASGLVGEVYCEGIPARNNLEVNIGNTPENPYFFQVLEINKKRRNYGFDYKTRALVENHAGQHQWPDEDTVFIDKRQFMPLRVAMTEPASIGVSVYRGIVKAGNTYYVLDTQDVDLTDYAIFGDEGTLAKFVLIEVVDGAINVVDGSEVAFADLDWETDIPESSTGGFALAAVRIYAGQDAVREPRTGGNDIMDLRYSESVSGTSHLKVEIIEFDTTYTETGNEPAGSVYYNSDEDSLDFVTATGAVAQLPQETYFYARNNSGAEITNGTPVMFSGTIGASGRITIQEAIADGTYPSEYVMGLVTETIANDADGKVTWFGKVRGIDTTGTPYGETWNDGDLIYVSPDTAGYLTNVEPDAPNLSILVAAVVYAHATTGTLFVRPAWSRNIEQLDNVDGNAPTQGATLVYNETDETWNAQPIFEDTADPTGWVDPAAVDAATTYDSSARTISISGTHYYYWRGEKKSITNYTSAAHDSAYDTYFLYSTDGDTFAWSTSVWDFDMAMLALANYQSTYAFALGEAHGVMPWQVHQSLHRNFGTYKVSGGTLDPASYALASTTAADRRPDVVETELDDEDIPHTLDALTSGVYTQMYLTSTTTNNFVTSAGDIVPLSGNQPYWNEFTGGAWTQTLMANNSYMCVWLVGVPVTQDATSQAYRYVWVQGQNNPTTADGAEILTPQELNIGELTDQIPESVFLLKVTLRYTAANWQLYAVDVLSGSRYSQSATSGGAYLTGVTATAPLDGIGTLSDPLLLQNDAAATITEIDTGALASSDTVIPTSQAVITYASGIDYSFVSGNDAATDVTGAQLEELSDGSETTLHDHPASAINATDSGGYFTGTDLETITQEIGADLATIGAGDGWIEVTDTWTRTGDFTFTVTGDQTAVYRKGLKVKYNDGSVDYGVIASSVYSSVTTVTLVSNDDYAMAAATITGTYLSYVERPDGFPAYFNYAPNNLVTLGNGTRTGRWKTNGNQITYEGHITWGSTTSWNSSDVTLPVSVDGFYPTGGSRFPLGICVFLDAGTAVVWGNAVYYPTDGRARIQAQPAGGTYTTTTVTTANVPFTWTTSDEMSFNISYIF